LSRVGVTYKTGFVLDDWIYWIFETRNYRQYSAIQFTVTHALRFSVFTSRILATDSSRSHCSHKSHMKSSFHSLIPFLPLSCNRQFRRQAPIHFLCSQAHNLAGWRPETRLFTLRCSVVFLFTTTFHGPHGKHPLLLYRHSNGRGTDHTENSLSIVEASLPQHVFTKSLPSSGYTRHSTIKTDSR
jgi:hypothetical protein